MYLLNRDEAIFVYIILPSFDLISIIIGIILAVIGYEFGIPFIVVGFIFMPFYIFLLFGELFIHLRKKKADSLKKKKEIIKLLEMLRFKIGSRFVFSALEEIVNEEDLEKIINYMDTDRYFHRKNNIILFLGYLGLKAKGILPDLKTKMNETENNWKKFHYAAAIAMIEGRESEGLKYIEERIDANRLDATLQNQMPFIYRTIISNESKEKTIIIEEKIEKIQVTEVQIQDEKTELLQIIKSQHEMIKTQNNQIAELTREGKSKKIHNYVLLACTIIATIAAIVMPIVI